MEINYTPCPEPTEIPCLMKNQFNEVFLATDNIDGNVYVTRVSCSAEDMDTYRCDDLKDFKPLPKGTKVEFIN